MEHTTSIINSRDEVAAKNRFESFKLGKGLPSSMPTKHSHARSHSRNASISSSVSSMSFSMSSKSMNSADMSNVSLPTHAPGANPAQPSKRNSHHRRRSSVSTRIESAEMMGVSIPDLPPTSEDNINLGEKDSIRRRALWALEGKPDVSYAKVEIPELSTPVMEKIMFDLSTKPSMSQSIAPSFGPGLTTSMSNKRDSFKLLASSSSKDPLHTLVEEEEEEEEEATKQDIVLPMTPSTPITPSVAITKATPSRPRPANLSLRPLSLTPENLISASSGLPTPSLTPSPRIGLKSLALSPSHSITDNSINSTDVMTTRQSITPSPGSQRLSLDPLDPLNPSVAHDSPVSSYPVGDDKPHRRSSIPYKSSSSSSSSNGVVTNFAGLPTPEMTPTSFDRRSISSSRRDSASSNEEDFPPSHQTRPLSASEQHFLFKSHNALVARITDLERALSSRRSSGGFSNNGSSRPVSVVSNISSSSDYDVNGEPSDEMLRLISDLKAERDELKRDVDGWRTRIGDMEKQLSVVANRVECERRDAWVARSMVGLLEVEKGALEKKLEDTEKTMLALEDDNAALKREAKEANDQILSLSAELEKAKQELHEERKFREVQVPTIDISTTSTPDNQEPQFHVSAYSVKKALGFTSVDSESSTTDVEDSFEETSPKLGFSLKAVAEEEDEDLLSPEENGLAGYEDEDDSDISFHSSSSFGSESEFPRSVKHLQSIPSSVTSTSTTPIDGSRSTSSVPLINAPHTTHALNASLPKTWKFPIGTPALPARLDRDSDVDKFFGCLEDADGESNAGSTPTSPSVYNYEMSKSLFSSGFKYSAEHDDSPFFFPGGVGVEDDEGPQRLDAVEEDEDEDEVETEGEGEGEQDMFGDAGGIRITFTPPDADESFDHGHSSSPNKPSIPAINFFENVDKEEDSVTSTFGYPVVQQKTEVHGVFSTPPSSVLITPPSSIPRSTSQVASPSAIPRATFKPPTNIATSTPTKALPTRMSPPDNYATNAFVTPPNKRGGTMPSFIPQAISSPSPMRNTSVSARQKTRLTLTRQPPRKPLASANGTVVKNQSAPSNSVHVNPAMNPRSLRRSSDLHATHSVGTASEMKSIDLSAQSAQHNIFTTPMHKYPVLQDYPASHTTAGSAGSSSSLSSIITSSLSTRLSFTNFIPSWAPHSAPISEAVTPLSVSPSLNSSPTQKRNYVPKEKQLKKLRSRYEREGMMRMRTSVNICCKNCNDEVVFL